MQEEGKTAPLCPPVLGCRRGPTPRTWPGLQPWAWGEQDAEEALIPSGLPPAPQPGLVLGEDLLI